MQLFALLNLLLSVILAGPSDGPPPVAPTPPRLREAATPMKLDSAQRVLTGEERRVVAAIQALFSAAEKNDVTALDSIYAGTDLTIIESTGMNRGWADYRDHHLAPEMKEMKNFRYRPFEIEPHAWAIFRYNLAAETGGRVIDNIGRGTAVLEKRRGRWVVRHTHTASRARRPTDPPANY